MHDASLLDRWKNLAELENLRWRAIAPSEELDRAIADVWTAIDPDNYQDRVTRQVLPSTATVQLQRERDRWKELAQLLNQESNLLRPTSAGEIPAEVTKRVLGLWDVLGGEPGPRWALSDKARAALDPNPEPEKNSDE